jgi:thymidylate synthase
MKSYLQLLRHVLQSGEERNTRSGEVIGTFGENLQFDLRDGFPAVTSKRLAFKSMVGELLWFLNGKTDLKSLRNYSDLPEDAWTIWSDDCNRWHSQQKRFDPDLEELPTDDLGELYGVQWRSFTGLSTDIDQIEKLVESLRENPSGRYHIVNSWNVDAINTDAMALAPCHVMFQCYVSSDGHLDLIWYQRSVDMFLGLPFNIASYALLLEILAKLLDLTPRYLKAQLGDCHIYEGHVPAVKEQLRNKPVKLPTVEVPELYNVRSLAFLTAKDFKLNDYHHAGAIKAPLSVG